MYEMDLSKELKQKSPPDINMLMGIDISIKCILSLR